MKFLFWLAGGIGLVAGVNWLARRPETWHRVAAVSAFAYSVAEDMHFIITGDELFCVQCDGEGAESPSAEDTAGAAEEYLREQREDA